MAKAGEIIPFEITEHISTLSTYGVQYTLELNRVSFNGHPAKLDLRKWHNGKPLKGVQLSCREATLLCTVLPGAIQPDEESRILEALRDKLTAEGVLTDGEEV